jgi:hypothetical protein
MLPHNTLYYFFPFSTVKHISYGKNEIKAILLWKILFFRMKKEDFPQNPQGLVLLFRSWNIPLCTDENGKLKTVGI